MATKAAAKTTKKVRLIDLAYARSGDKGDICNIGLMAHDAKKYAIIKKVVTPEKIKAFFKDWVKGDIKIYPMDNINSLEIVMYHAMGGGATNTLRIDQTGKCMCQNLLRMEVEIQAVPDIIYEKKDHLALITLNRPEARNAYTYDMALQWESALIDFRDDPDMWVAIITGNGPAFCAGADLKELSQPATRDRLLGFVSTRAHYLINTEIYKPSICAINGTAAGGGCEFALSCDIRIMADTARIGLTEAKVGMGANFGTHKLTRMIPLGIAFEKMFTGSLISAEEALRWGLANKVVPGADLMAEAKKLAAAMLECAPLSLRRMKENAIKGRELPLIFAARLNLGPDVYKSEDQLEGARAFAEKRKPNWKGK